MASLYVCRVCAGHIGHPGDFEYCYTLKGITGGVFQNLTNFHLDDDPRMDYQTIGDHKVTNVHCNTCNSLLGFKFIEVPIYEGGPCKEDFLIPLNTLFMYDGHHFLDAQTEDLIIG
ncbi:uncharacterized protein LOC124922741 [Impatiens glandulifera]|uniref:uncharacterized protein LOC124922741 n=1 Tax=Impatiens glandulifera TaxID=253017 RepID=UPI001FB08C1A|nr:uncharacterized protein LOC124922741 [Impatiens glandulifera]